MNHSLLNEFAVEITSGEWPEYELYRFDDSRIEQYSHLFLEPGQGVKEREVFCRNADRVSRCLMKFWFTCHGWDGQTLRRPGNWEDIDTWAGHVEHISSVRNERDTHVYDCEFLAGYVHFLNMLLRASDSYIRSCIDLDLGRVRIPKRWENTYRYIALPNLYEIELECRRSLR